MEMYPKQYSILSNTSECIVVVLGGLVVIVLANGPKVRVFKTGRGRCILTNSVAQEPEGSSPHSQQPATGPCPEPV
jgi:hypothetical protein